MRRIGQAGDAPRRVDAVNDALRAEVGGEIQLPEAIVPEPELDEEPDGLPLIDSGWGWAEQTRRLKASKSYEDAS
jgi:hypothetical protein